MSSTLSPAWQRSGLAFGLLLVAALLIYRDTLSSMAAIWWRSDTFAHGAIVFPVCAWLAWRKREALAALEPCASAAGLLALALLVAAWLFAHLADVLVAEQLALIAMIPALVWALLGPRALRVLAFPLAFALFAVPFGEGLIPGLMEFTASFTVRALELTGIPVYREGLHFSIPSGDFEVATACSGIRYLIASLALGTLYAHLTYRTLWRRVLFIALALVVPLLANGTRAYLIVLIAYLSDMRLAVGVDHLIYGWLFFGLVMFALFWLGFVFREREPAPPPSPPGASAARSAGHPLAPALIAMVLLLAAPGMAHQLGARSPAGGAAPALPAASAGWRGPLAPQLDWQPSYAGASFQRMGRYVGPDAVPVQVAIVGYSAQRQGAELINSENRPYDRDWKLLDIASALAPDGAGGMHSVQVTRLQGAAGKLLVWHWYVIGAQATASESLAKLYQVWAALRRRSSSANLIAVATPEEPDAASASARLADYVRGHAPALTTCLRGAGPGCSG